MCYQLIFTLMETVVLEPDFFVVVSDYNLKNEMN